MSDERGLFDEESEENPPARGGSGNVTRREFIAGAAAAGAAVGVIGTIGVQALVGGGEEEAGPGAPPAGTGTPIAPAGPSGGGGAAERGMLGVPNDAAVPDAVVMLNVNGADYLVSVDANESLAEVLRRKMNLTGTSIGCDRSECSACTVQIDGVATNSCSVLAIRQDGREIVTIESLERDGVLSPVQEAFLDEMGLQCGFCTTGQIMQATALLQANPNPTETEIRHGMSGNLCKCSAYKNILAAVGKASENLG